MKTATTTTSKSQSPLVGAFVPAIYSIRIQFRRLHASQSPLVGAFVPANGILIPRSQMDKSQSPLVGAFVPANNNNSRATGKEHVAIPSGRGIRSGAFRGRIE